MRHTIHYSILTMIRDRQAVFWSLIFPIILLTVIGLPIKQAMSHPTVITTPHIDLVDDAMTRRHPTLYNLPHIFSGDKTPLTVTLSASVDQAKNRVANGTSVGYLTANEAGRLTFHIGSTTLRTTIASTIMTSYETMSRALSSGGAGSLRDDSASPDSRTLWQTATWSAPPQPLTQAKTTSPYVAYIYSQLAMQCLYAMAGFIALNGMNNPRVHAVGIRMRTGTPRPLRIDLGNAIAAMIFGLLITALYLIFARLVVGVDFGLSQAPGIVALLIVATLIFGLALAAVIDAFSPSRRENARMMAFVFIAMMLLFLSGMVVMSLRDTLSQSLPLLAHVNPTDRLIDGLIAINVFADRARALTDAAWIGGVSVVLLVLSFWKKRRMVYDSL